MHIVHYKKGSISTPVTVLPEVCDLSALTDITLQTSRSAKFAQRNIMSSFCFH